MNRVPTDKELSDVLPFEPYVKNHQARFTETQRANGELLEKVIAQKLTRIGKRMQRDCTFTEAPRRFLTGAELTAYRALYEEELHPYLESRFGVEARPATILAKDPFAGIIKKGLPILSTLADAADLISRFELEEIVRGESKEWWQNLRKTRKERQAFIVDLLETPKYWPGGKTIEMGMPPRNPKTVLIHEGTHHLENITRNGQRPRFREESVFNEGQATSMEFDYGLKLPELSMKEGIEYASWMHRIGDGIEQGRSYWRQADGAEEITDGSSTIAATGGHFRGLAAFQIAKARYDPGRFYEDVHHEPMLLLDILRAV